MPYYGCAITDEGRNLIAKVLVSDYIHISRIMVGQGVCPDDQDFSSVTDLFDPVAQATSNTPIIKDGILKMKIEYRSDLNGGLDYGFWLSEFGIFALDPDTGDEILFLYASLGDAPQYVKSGATPGIDVRRFPVSIVIGKDVGVIMDFNPELWLTEEDLLRIYTETLLPMIRDEIDRKIDEHNKDKNAHYGIYDYIQHAVLARLCLNEAITETNKLFAQAVDYQMYFLNDFVTLNGVTVTGTWNETMARMEF